MAKIKIISNPYEERTSFRNWDGSAGQWQELQESNPNSNLLGDEIARGFFPFKAEKILLTILQEYQAGPEPVEIVFEGTGDEYRELEGICQQENYAPAVRLSKSEQYLENARDILPDIITDFQALRDIFNIYQEEGSPEYREQYQRQAKQFADASNDTVPICVIGNYSSGKSTFINSLIGYELLPSSDEPTTAKIFQISRSDYADRATITFEYEQARITIYFQEDGYSFSPVPAGNPLVGELKAQLDQMESARIEHRLNRALDVINQHAGRVSHEVLSDLIRIVVPFSPEGFCGKTHNNFMIFDTPGSNSASNARHYQVLQEAMRNLTNGLPIFVSEYTTLDSTDNDKLYQDINDMKELDNRFTMIIVNKADAASLPPELLNDQRQEKVLDLAIPRKLYAGGIYFLSSVLGLASKNSGSFLNDHNAEVFEDNEAKYSDPAHRRYRQLYRYDILPAQIKRSYDATVQKRCDDSPRTQDLLYANSGLEHVEQAIESFVTIYAPYNKCQQSRMFLQKIIQMTEQKITESKEQAADNREAIRNLLNEKQQQLVDELQTCSSEEENTAHEAHGEKMVACCKEVTKASLANSRELADRESELTQEKNDLKGTSQQKDHFMDAVRALGKSLLDTLDFSQPSVQPDLAEDGKELWASLNRWKDSLKSAQAESSDSMTAEVAQHFTEVFQQAQNQMVQASQFFWTEQSCNLRQVLMQVVTKSEALDDEKRTELSNIIMQFQPLHLKPPVDQIFIADSFRHRFMKEYLGLNIQKLARIYNKEMKASLQKVCASLMENHYNSFHTWLQSLLDMLTENIDKFNPVLHRHVETLRKLDADLQRYARHADSLRHYTQEIGELMDWQDSTLSAESEQ